MSWMFHPAWRDSMPHSDHAGTAPDVKPEPVQKTFVPHDQLAPGLWYLRTRVKPYYTVVKVGRMAIGPDEGQLRVWRIDEEGCVEVEAFADDQFIGPVPAPTSL